MKRLALLLLVAALVASTAVLAERDLRLGRDLIFHSSDVAGFTLPNGRHVRTNRWYDRVDLMDEGQMFYTGGNGLGLMNPKLDGFATITDDGGGSRFLRLLKSHETIQSMSVGPEPVEQGAVGELKVKAGYTEYWVCRQGTEALR